MCVLAVFTQFLKALRLRVEMRWAAQARARQQCCCAPAGDLEAASAASKDGTVDDKDAAAPAAAAAAAVAGDSKSCCSGGLAAVAPESGEAAVPTSSRQPAWRRQGALTLCGRQLITRDQVGDAVGCVSLCCVCAAGCCCSCCSLSRCRNSYASPHSLQQQPLAPHSSSCAASNCLLPAPAPPCPALQARRNFWRASFTFVVIFLDYGGWAAPCPPACHFVYGCCVVVVGGSCAHVHLSACARTWCCGLPAPHHAGLTLPRPCLPAMYFPHPAAALMLVVMTFNIGIILAVCGGFAIGALLFGHAGEKTSTSYGGANGGSSAMGVGGRGAFQPGQNGPLSRATTSSSELEAVFVEGSGCCSGGSGCGGGGAGHGGGQL